MIVLGGVLGCKLDYKLISQKQLINILTIINKNRFTNMCDLKKKKTHTQIYSDGQPVTMVTANNEGKK